MKQSILVTLCSLLFALNLFGQSINNTLGLGGSFTIKDGTTTFLTLSQSDGYLGLNRSLTLPVSTGDTLGVIFKGADRFLHDYWASGTSGWNTFLGINAGNFSMSGVGGEGSYNTGIGGNTLSSLTTGNSNVAMGVNALQSNTSGVHNTAIGKSALSSNTTGDLNTVVGSSSLLSNTTGTLNTALGYQSLSSNATGGENTAVGSSSMISNTTGGQNTALGSQSLYYNTAGQHNTAVGFIALQSSTADNNTALGYSAGWSITTGSNLTCIGYNALSSSDTVMNEITLGNQSVQWLRCAALTITAVSDARDKKNIKDLPLGLDFVMNVRPRLFNWDRREWYENGKPDGSKMQEKPTAGFIAQELDEAQISAKVEWLNLVLKSNPDRLEATPGNLLPIMVKAIQELKGEKDAEVAKMRSENEALKTEVQSLKKTNERVAELERLVRLLDTKLAAQ